MEQLTGKDRLIVALDVPTVDEALQAVDRLDNVSFYKIGLQLFMTGGLLTLLQRLRRTSRVFVDLKVPGDIANTIKAVIDMCAENDVAFLTLSESMPLPSIAAAKAARTARHSEVPKLLTVPFLSSLDAGDLPGISGGRTGPRIVHSRQSAQSDRSRLRRRHRLRTGHSGLPAGFCQTDADCQPRDQAGRRVHRRSQAAHDPGQAIHLGADYLVVGRPILKDPDPREAARRVIAEIDDALEAAGTAPGAQSQTPGTSSARLHLSRRVLCPLNRRRSSRLTPCSPIGRDIAA